MIRYWVLSFCLLMLAVTVGQAQNDCGVVDGIGFPVDTGTFTVAQEYGVASERHEGRYHTGVDWYAGRDSTIGEPIYAAARGRVTFSSTNGWGRDGGVIIIEHTFPNGDVFYTQYGHITETPAYPFPARLSCVQVGDPIGAVADVRPAPHLHFEVRIAGGLRATNPGAGYTTLNPYDEGYRNPTKFILNQQTWLSLWHEWHLMIGASQSVIDERGVSAPLLTLNDNSVLYLDGAGLTVRRATPDGRILWRIRLEQPAVSITAFQGTSLLTFADGTMQLVNVESGALGDSWRVDAIFTGSPLVDNDTLLFPAENQTLVRVSADRRSILQTINDVPAYQRAFITPVGRIAILTTDNQFRYYDSAGNIVNTAQLRASADFANSWDGQLLVYSLGGLWQVDAFGVWSLYIEDAPAGGTHGALLVTDNRIYVFDGLRLTAYDSDLTQLWQANTPPVTGSVDLTLYNDVLTITSTQGDVLLVNQQGGFCNQVRVYGNEGARQWHELGADNIFRFAVADQILALDWDSFASACRL